MPEFNWQATSSTGDKRKGTMEAANPEAVHAALRRQGLNPTRVRTKPKEIKISIPGFSEKVKDRDIVIFTRPLAAIPRSSMSFMSTWWPPARRAVSWTLS